MPSLKASIDASGAKAGAETFNKAAQHIAEAAVRLDMGIGVLQSRVDHFANTLKGTTASVQSFLGAFAGASAIKDATAAIKELNDALLGMTKSRREALNATRELSKANAESKVVHQQTAVAVAEVSKKTDALTTLLKQAKYAVLGYFSAFTAISVIKSSTEMMGKFDESMRLIGVVTGATADELRGLTEEARHLGATTRFNAQQVSEAMYELSKAGFSAQETLESISSTLNLAQASLISMSDAAAIVSNTIRQFELSTTDATRVADVLLLTANRSNASVQGLGETMKYAGAIAHGFGASLEQVAAMAGVLANRGMDASMAGTNIRGIMLQLATVTDAGKEALREMGLTFRDVAPDVHSFTDILRKLRDGHLDATKAGILFDTRNAGAALILSKNVDEIEKFDQALQDAAGTSQAAADAMNDSLRGSLLKMKAAFLDLILATGDAGYSGVLKAMANTTAEAVRILAGVRGAQEEASTTAQVLAVSFRAAAEATAFYVSIRLAQWLATATSSLKLATLSLATFRAGMAASTASTLTFQGAMYAAGVATRTLGVAFKSLWASLGPAGWLVLGLTAGVELYSAMTDKSDELAVSTRVASQEFDGLSQALDELKKSSSALAMGRDVESYDQQTAALRRQIQTIEELRNQLNASGKGTTAFDMKRVFSNAGIGNYQNLVANYQLQYLGANNFKQDPAYNDLSKRLSEGSLTAAEAVQFLNQAIKQLQSTLSDTTAAKEAQDQLIRYQQAIKATVDSTEDEIDLLQQQMAIFLQSTGSVDQATRAMNNHREIVLAVRKAEAAAQENAMRLSDAERAAIIESTKSLQQQRDALEDAVNARKSDEDAIRDWTRAQEEAAEEATRLWERQLEEWEREVQRAEEVRQQQLETAEAIIQAIVDENEVMQKQVDLRGEDADTIALELDYLKAVQQVRELDIDNRDEVLARIREQLELQKELKKWIPKSADGKSTSDFMHDLENEERLIGLSNDARERAIAMTKAYNAAMIEFGGSMEQVNAFMEQYEAALERVQTKREIIEFAHEMSDAFTDAVADIIYEVDSLEDAFRQLYIEISKLALQKFALTPISNFLSGILGSFAGNIGLTGGANITSAKGNVFTGGRKVHAFAQGGIINTPTYFPLAGGDTGLAGEAGPEVAIAPLRRTKGGDLGVNVEGLVGGKNTVINVNINAKDADSFRRSMPQISAELRRAITKSNER